MSVESVYSDYKVSEDGLSYILYDKPLTMSTTSFLENYPEGGFILFSENENMVGYVDVYLHAKENYDIGLYDVFKFKNLLIRAAEDDNVLDLSILMSLKKKHLKNVYKFNLDFINLKAMPQEEFDNSFLDEIEKSVKLLKRCYSATNFDIKLIIKFDNRHKNVIYYGYYYGDFPKKYAKYRDSAMQELTLGEAIRLRNLARKCKNGIKGGSVSASPDNFAKITKVCKTGMFREIGSWIEENSYNDLLNVIKDRVRGQEDVDIVVASIYNYLFCMANGMTHNNNTIIAAPSGCGKTETFRAIRDYFEEALPKLPVYQLDMTSITEEGFKGKDTNAIIEPLLEKSDTNGMGIVFLDEFDKKLAPSYSNQGQNVNASVQNQILTLIEGRSASNGKNDGCIINTANTLFIGLGSFDAFRSKRENIRTEAGFGSSREEKVSHYSPIERADMIEHGASYELLGRFSTIVNYHELSYEAVDQIILMQLKKTVQSYGCNIELGKSMMSFLHENANSKYGCRMIESLIRESALDGYISILKNGKGTAGAKILINAPGEATVSLPRGEEWIC